MVTYKYLFESFFLVRQFYVTELGIAVFSWYPTHDGVSPRNLLCSLLFSVKPNSYTFLGSTFLPLLRAARYGLNNFIIKMQ